MAISHNTERWLQEAGYKYHCFISWAHAPKSDLIYCVDNLKEAIEKQLAYSIPTPCVFLDKAEMAGGDEWQKRIANALCRSIALVAVCAPIYYHPDHEWCGFEWEAMHRLSKKRLAGRDFTSIIPVMIKPSNPLPGAVSQIQWIDLSRFLVGRKRFFKTQEFNLKVGRLVERIEEIAEATAQNSSLADCSQFEIPRDSAFADYQASQQPFPFRS